MRGMLAGVLGWAILLGNGQALAESAGGRADTAVANAQIAVVYPDIGEPYRSVFEQIISGIEDKARAGVAKFAVGQSMDVAALKDSLRQRNIKVVIALGYQGMKAAAMLDRDMGVVVGGIIAPPENELRGVPVNSLSPDPSLMFTHLRALMPAVRRVLVVYDPRQNGWLIRLARDAARVQGLELVAYEAQDLRIAVRTYQDIFAAADTRKDALWLLQDSISAESGTVLPLVLQESWSHNMTVFSSNFGHVRRGVLFSLYPDNVEMGRHLAGTALEYLDSGDYGTRGLILLREVLVAINLRTANHLGLKPGKNLEFGMVFPEQ